jgi:hypothetical protein
MVVSDLDVFWPTIGPDEADAVLLIDANRMLPVTISTQRFKPIPWRKAQTAERDRSIELVELPSCH